MSNLAESPITMAGKILQQDTRAGIKGAIISAENETLGKEIRQSTKDDGAYTFLLEPGRWKISITCPGYVSPDAKDDVFSTDVQQTDVLLSPGVSVNGTVFWLGTREHVSGAVIKAFLRDSQGNKLRPHSTYANGYGNFEFTKLNPGKWEFVVLHENGLSSEPFEQEIAENADNLWLHIPRRQGNKDATAGWIFLTVLSVILISLAIIYVALHNNYRRSSSVQSAVFLNQVDKVIQQLTESTKPSEDTELNTSMATIQNIWDVIAGATTLPQSKTGYSPTAYRNLSARAKPTSVADSFSFSSGRVLG